MKRIQTIYLLIFLLLTPVFLNAANRTKYNFNPEWLLKVGDFKGAEAVNYPDGDWKKVTLPHAWNEDEAFKVNIRNMTDTVSWYRKHFKLPVTAKGKKVFVEFEGVRQAADIYLNGKHIGLHENGVMAFGIDLTPYVNFGGENVIAVRTDSNWRYKERATGSLFQWNDINFNANYGGIPKNVWLHVTDRVYQTLPLYSNLQTTGVYVYATDIQVQSRKAVVNAESEIRNEYKKPVEVGYQVEVLDYEGKQIGLFNGEKVTIKPGETTTVKASKELGGLHFWSWGYGYLYQVKTRLVVDGEIVDEVITRTGFRKTHFGKGKVWLNDRVLQMKGYAQRSSNEWPGVGMSVPAWMSDYSNQVMLEHNANFYRWMHVTPWKQDVESCDRTGVIQMMPAGDAERDANGRRWEQRKELMRDAIIYMRNNPSVIFYESGNESISREHMLEMIAVRDKYDPHGGRAIGSREMLDIREAEYGGEMLYINKSEHHPMIQTEYCRDEGLRKYWDEYSYPFHKEGAGPLHKGQDASSYNHNQDQLAVEFVRRWYDYWRERPGTGRRVNSGGAQIVFSDTQTYGRGEENYRRSGVVDPLRIPKDGFYAHQVMWDGWVDVEKDRTYIIGHWNYTPEVVKPVYVVSTGDKVELFVNGRSKGFGKQDYRFLFTFDSIQWEKGKIEAVAYDKTGKEESRYAISTVGEPNRLKLTLMHGPKGVYADGADIAMVQVEVVDKDGNRCPLANDMISFDLQGPAEWRGGIAQAEDNFVLAKELPVECGVTRVIIRSGVQAGNVTLNATAKGLGSESVSFSTIPVEVHDGLTTFNQADELPSLFERGETPSSPSYVDRKIDVRVKDAIAGIDSEHANASYDDNELSEWKNDGHLSTAWITYQLERYAEIDDICIKLTGWRRRSYPIEVYAGDVLVWSGKTDRSLGYVHLSVKPVRANTITIRLQGATQDADAFGQITEVAAATAGELDLYKAEGGDKTNNELRIVEIEFLETLNE
ncbi:glycoside hydrolase family 2 protein [Mangrovibacterium marinum]|uniref:Glycosyl hydrolase family 2 n=1 Tax=Mangrovibacterium marinum TaxID=1639118 RepID=A0A2T5BXV4_9BACT|nr:sugar-binding domain-containing protein [Mangrovibacterium marinum]PTN05915.1 glycosyl hydrolase family 2 [Mangrovibacterium marinum]